MRGEERRAQRSCHVGLSRCPFAAAAQRFPKSLAPTPPARPHHRSSAAARAAHPQTGLPPLPCCGAGLVGLQTVLHFNPSGYRLYEVGLNARRLVQYRWGGKAGGGCELALLHCCGALLASCCPPSSRRACTLRDLLAVLPISSKGRALEHVEQGLTPPPPHPTPPQFNPHHPRHHPAGRRTASCPPPYCTPRCRTW